MPRLKVLAMPACAILLVLLTFSIAGCGDNRNRGERVILVSIAASLKDSAQEIAGVYERAHPHVRIQFNFGSSGTLQKQIEQGAPADLFLSAGRQQMDTLISKKLVKESKPVLANRLVLIVPADLSEGTDDVNQLLDSKVRTIALGEPNTVPAGVYARQSLISLGLWDQLQNKAVYAKDVRQVLTFVETGNADAGFVYRTDAVGSRKAKIALELSPDSHDPIEYPFGLLSEAKYPREAEEFYRYLTSEPALAIFEKYGFLRP